MRAGHLAGLRVLDLSALLPPPVLQMLADLAADVIEVERPGGDAARRLPGSLHAGTNRNQRSVGVRRSEFRRLPVQSGAR